MPYYFTQFEQPSIEFTEGFSESVLDTNGNGLYDFLLLGVGVNVTSAGNYTLTGYLHGNGSAVIAQNTSFLAEGIHSVFLNFSGLEIRVTRKNGPYKLGLLSASNSSGDIDLLYDSFNTSPYLYTQHQG